MKATLTQHLLHYGYDEVVVSNKNNRLTIHRAAKAGKLRKLATGIYTTNFKDVPEKIIRTNVWKLAGMLFPNAIIADRTALEQRPAKDGSIFLISEKRATHLKLPGIFFRLRQGHGPIEGYDMPFLGALWMSSQARALLDNLVPTRQRKNVARTFSQEELEEYLDKILRHSGPEVLNKLRDQAHHLGPQLKMKTEAKKLSSIIGAMMGTQKERLQSAIGISRAKGNGFDKERMELFEQLRADLAVHPFATVSMRKKSAYLAFFESYFSNFIEGTEFDVEEAHDIVFEGKIIKERLEDAHDILGTFKIVSDSKEMSRVAKNSTEFIKLLRYRHSIILKGRPDKHPGQFKQHHNRAGKSLFVSPELVLGTLERGFQLLEKLQHPMARALYVMFLIAEVHPFTDGNGRISRIMMNAELHREGQERIMIPNVYRMEYLQSLRALTHNQRPTPLISVMKYAQRFVSKINFSNYEKAVEQLKKCHAFGEPADAMGEGDKLIVF
ncbi:MAG: Fic family protein [Chthoniobacterales bacterium]|nr:Fic family protein [Chthoniobacterales bacterium]